MTRHQKAHTCHRSLQAGRLFLSRIILGNGVLSSVVLSGIVLTGIASNSWAGALHDAAETGNVSRIQQLVSAGANIDEIDARGIWPLLAAVTDGNTATVALLLKLKANPNQTDQYQYSALHEAATLGHHTVMELLIDAKANINARDVNGITPLGYAMRSPSREAVALLQSLGGIQ